MSKGVRTLHASGNDSQIIRRPPSKAEVVGRTVQNLVTSRKKAGEVIRDDVRIKIGG